MARTIEIETATQFWGSVEAAPGETDTALFLRASIVAARFARENRRPRGEFFNRYEPDHLIPVAGGATRTAAELGLPLIV